MALLRARAEGARPPSPRGRVTDLLRFAERHGIAQPMAEALRPALPAPAAALLIDPMLAAGQEAARARAAQLADIARRLAAAGAPAVALKGAAFAAADPDGAPWRGMIDLDLMVAPEALPGAVAALEAAGYRGEDEAFLPRTDYHFPALIPPGPGLAVELHSRPGWRRGGPLSGLAARARPSAVPGLAIPAPEDRLAHLALHAQVADRGWRRRRLRLRDALDWRALVAGEAEPEAVERRCARSGLGREFRAFAAAMARIWGEGARVPAAWAAAEADWADRALAGLADPDLAARGDRADAPWRLYDALTTPETLAHGVAGLFNAARRRRFLRHLSP